MGNKNKAVVGILMMVVLFFSILMLFAFYTLNIFNNTQVGDLGSSNASIAVVEVEGVIMDSKKTIELLNMAEEDDQVKAIIVRVDSPGGAVGPSQEIYEEIIRIDEKKPVYASFGTVSASGGYYIGSAARKIFSNPGTLTGSIGVIMEFVDVSKILEMAKVSAINLKSGKYKDIGRPTRPMTAEEKSLIENLIKGVHKQFINDVLRRRKDKIKGDINELAQGQIFSGQEAFELGLVDELAGLWNAGRKIQEELQIPGKFGLKFIKKKKRPSWVDFMDGLDGAISRFMQLMNKAEGPRLMFGS